MMGRRDARFKHPQDKPVRAKMRRRPLIPLPRKIILSVDFATGKPLQQQVRQKRGMHPKIEDCRNPRANGGLRGEGREISVRMRTRGGRGRAYLRFRRQSTVPSIYNLMKR